MSEAHEDVTSQSLREAMRLVPTPVTVVTVGGPEPRGITIGSFVSTSLEPPLVSFNVQRNARAHDLLAAAEGYVVNVLASDQSALSDLFANAALTGAEQFREVATSTSIGGAPVLVGALSVFECRPYARYDAGDHSIFVGRVVGLSSTPSKTAVLYADRGYRAVGSVITPRAPSTAASEQG